MRQDNKHGMLRLDETEAILKSSFRTLALFEYFADVQAPVSIGDISANLNIPQSSASALVKSLVESGYVIKISTRHYAPTLRLSMLCGWIDEDAAALPKLTQIMQALCREFEETFVLAMRNGIYSQYIFVQSMPGTIREHVETGSLRPLLCASTGWAILAHDTDADIGKLIRRTRSETENLFWRKTAEMAPEHIALTRQNGFAFSEGPDAKGTAGVAISLPSRKPSFTFALAAAGTTQAIGQKKDAIAAALLALRPDFSRDITAQILGAPPQP